MPAKNLRFYMIRHGRTEWNEQGLLQGSGDSPLTEQGAKGAILTGKKLADVPFGACYSSLMPRAIATAQHILQQRPIPFFQHKGLNEQFFGSWEGKFIGELRQLPEFQQMQEDAGNYQALSNGGETFADLQKRAMQALQDIIQVHDEGNILIVSHGHTLRLLLALFSGFTWQNHRDPNKSKSILNTAINIVRYEQQTNESEGKFILEQLNDIQHLG